MSETPREVEAKFRAGQRTFRVLEQLDEIDGWRVAERRSVNLRDTYWDTPDRQLGHTGRTLRVRELDCAPVGELTYKGPVENGSRTEETATAPAGSVPAQWAAIPEAADIVRALRQRNVLEALRPDVVLLNPRRELVLRRGAAEEILSLDEVRIEGQPYARRYVELELKRGSRAGHDSLTQRLAERFNLRAARTGKVQAARTWLALHP